MIRVAAAALAAGVAVLAPAGAFAQERAGDAALGAISGAVVLGPVGAVAGAVVGYTAGPSISRSWGLHHRQTAAPRHRTRVVTASRAAAPRTRPPAAAAISPAPPVQTLE